MLRAKQNCVNLIAVGEAKAEELRKAVARGERLRFDDSLVRQHLGIFDEVWKTMTIEQQCRLLRQLVERVGYDARAATPMRSSTSTATRLSSSRSRP